jgi:4-aminobutyrate aminotransferase-like enzyme
MSAIHSQLKTKKIDSKQAADLIKSDTSLAQLDKAYVSNAYSEVTATPEEHLTFDNEFDAKIRALQPGDITDLYLAKFSYKKDQPPSDVAYVIAKMVDKKNGVITSQTEWLQDYKKQYEVTVL